MTVEQKATLLTATRGWNKISAGETTLSAFSPSVGKRGVKVSKSLPNYGAPTTSFPSPENVARSFDTQLAASVADLIAKEAVALGVNAVETPDGAVISDRDSRVGGELSEDAYLSGKMLASYIRGYEHNGVMAIMPFADEQYKTWLYREDKILREAGFEPYEIAVKEGEPSLIRISEGTLEGVPMAESKRLIDGILKTEWQYKGAVGAFDAGDVNLARALSLGVSYLPSAASSQAAKRLAAAVERYKDILVDIEAGSSNQAKLAAALASGEAVSEESLNEALEKLLATVDSHAVNAKENTDKYSSYPFNHAVIFDEQSHAELAFRAACDTIVLLKNEDGVLPISRDKKVALIGEYAFVSLADAAIDEDIVPLDTETAVSIASRSGLKIIGSAKGFLHNASQTEALSLADEAVALAADADVAVVFMGNLSDRSDAAIKAQLDLMERLRASTEARIVAVYFGNTSDMSWNDGCDAVLLAGDPGQGGARAIYAILNGSVNPSAKLAVGIYDEDVQTDIRDGLFGYRAAQAFNVTERYPFGFGLSYTTFEYSDMSVNEKGVTFTLRNTGGVSGTETVQLYVGRENSQVTPVRKELRGFTKVFLNAGESKRVTVPFDSRAFRYYNTVTHSFETEGGFYQIFVASSSRSLELIDEIEIPSSGAVIPSSVPVVTEEPKKKKKIDTGRLVQTIISGSLILLTLGLAVLYVLFLREELSYAFGVMDEIVLDIFAGVLGLGAMAGLIAWLAISVSKITLPEPLFEDSSADSWYHVPDRLYPEDKDKLVFSSAEGTDTSTADTYVAGASVTSDGTQPTAVRKYTVRRSSAAKAREAGVAALYTALRNYEDANGIYLADDELRELFAAFSASRNIAVRSTDAAATYSAIRALAECFGANTYRIETHENDIGIIDAHRALIDAIDSSVSEKDKLNIAIIDGDARIADMSEFMGQLINYTGSATERFVLSLGERAIELPENMWFVCIVPDDACIETYGMCVTRLRAQTDTDGDGINELVSDSDECRVLDAYDMTCDAFSEVVNSDMETYYLSETYWKKVDKLVEYVGARVPFKISNKTANAMERFITVCVGGGAEQTEALDCVMSAMLLCRISSQSAQLFDGDETLSEFMDSIFGADKDDRSRETVKLKGIK